jgi:hypothetical protein
MAEHVDGALTIHGLCVFSDPKEAARAHGIRRQPMLYNVLADLVLLSHLAFVVFASVDTENRPVMDT